MTRNRIVMGVILCFIFAPHTGAQNYVVADSTFIQSDVSDSYPRSVYNDIREVVKGYLADSSTEPIFFHGAGTGFDISAVGTNALRPPRFISFYCNKLQTTGDRT
jgi:hypothetical protein